MVKVVTFLVLMAVSIHAETRAKRLWHWSIAALAAANIADGASSIGQVEANPALGRQFGTQFVAVKAGVLLGTLSLQRWVLKRNPQAARLFVYSNFAAAAGLGAVATRNYMIRP